MIAFFTRYPVVFVIVLGVCVLATVGIFACIAAGMSDEYEDADEDRARAQLSVVPPPPEGEREVVIGTFTCGCGYFTSSWTTSCGGSIYVECPWCHEGAEVLPLPTKGAS